MQNPNYGNNPYGYQGPPQGYNQGPPPQGYNQGPGYNAGYNQPPPNYNQGYNQPQYGAYDRQAALRDCTSNIHPSTSPKRRKEVDSKINIAVCASQ